MIPDFSKEISKMWNTVWFRIWTRFADCTKYSDNRYVKRGIDTS